MFNIGDVFFKNDNDLLEQKINKIQEEINQYDDAYFIHDNPIISDELYDGLKETLRKLLQEKNKITEHLFQKKETPSILPLAPIRHGMFPLRRHIFPLYSLDNIFTFQGCEKFLTRIRAFLKLNLKESLEFLAEPKLDGICVNLGYVQGKFSYAITRGDGQQGEEITQNVMPFVPLILATNSMQAIPNVLEIRGEMVIALKDFQPLNSQRIRDGKTPFATPRHAAAGSLRQISSEETGKCPLKFIAHGAYAFEEDTCSLKEHKKNLKNQDSSEDFHWTNDQSAPVQEILEFSTDHNELQKQSLKNDHRYKPWSTQQALIESLKEWGFFTPIPTARCTSAEALDSFMKECLSQREALMYSLDGVVFKVNDIDFQNRLGFGQKTPRFAIAYKFPAAQGISSIQNIVSEIGRTGVITPVACIEPVAVGGVIIKRVSLHNWNQVKRLDLRHGDYVIVERAGDVIPYISKVVDRMRLQDAIPYVAPQNCPSCQTLLIQKEGYIALMCPEKFSCFEKNIQRLVYAVSDQGLDIKGFGEQHIRELYEKKWIMSLTDVFTFEQRQGTAYIPWLKDVAGWGNLSSLKLFQNIHHAKNTSLERFWKAWGISHIGSATAKILSQHISWNHLENFFEDELIRKDILEKLSHIQGIEAEAVLAIEEFSQIYGTEAIKLLKILNNQETLQVPLKDMPWIGQKFIFTGTLQSMSRAEAKMWVKNFGGHILSYMIKPPIKSVIAMQETDEMVSTHHFFAVIGEKAGKKLQQAQQKGMTLLSEDQWLEKLNEAKKINES